MIYSTNSVIVIWSSNEFGIIFYLFVEKKIMHVVLN